ncbi:MAG: hypothetical protein ABJB74_23130 [Gemmatimonas sp.]
MKPPTKRARFTAGTFAAALALSASVALAQDKSGAGGDGTEPSPGEQACDLIGCNNGSRSCGTATWSEWIWIPTPWVSIPWKFTESVSCYELLPVN